MALAASITEPPPKATMASQSSSASKRSMPRSTSGSGASGVTSSKTTQGVPPSAQRGEQRLHQAEARDHGVGDDEHLAVVEVADRLAEPHARPGPTIIVGCGIGSTRVTTPATRLTPGRPIERAMSPIKSVMRIPHHVLQAAGAVATAHCEQVVP
jgi:hypothetical protein